MDCSGKQKIGQEIAITFAYIFEEWKPTKMRIDKGREFYNQDVRKLIELYSKENEEKYCVVKDLVVQLSCYEIIQVNEKMRIAYCKCLATYINSSLFP